MFRIHTFLLILLFFSASLVHAQTIHYVNHAASGTNNGVSWTNAYTDLQSALNQASSGDEIWVAQGVYVPSVDSTGQVPTDVRLKTFRLKPGVRIYGGFLGNETAKIQRDWVRNPTVLSGETGDPLNDSDNVAHVVFAWGYFSDYAKLDGFSIIEGNAWALPWYPIPHGYFVNGGSAIYVQGKVKAIFQNIKVSRNRAGFSHIFVFGSHQIGGPKKDDVYFINLRGLPDNENYWGKFIRVERAKIHIYNSLIEAPISLFNSYTVDVINNGILFMRNSAVLGDTNWLPNSFGLTGEYADTLSIAHSIVTGHCKGCLIIQNAVRNVFYPFRPTGWDTARFNDPAISRAYARYLTYDNFSFRPRPDFFGVDRGDTNNLPFDLLDFDEDGDSTERIDFDIDMNPRVFGANVDIGPYEYYQSYIDTNWIEHCIGDSVFWEGRWRAGSADFSSIFHRGVIGDSVHRLILRHDSIKTTITRSPWGDYFTSDEADSGSTYQWIDCYYQDTIDGETGRTFKPSISGQFQVIITNRTGCVDTSECVNLPNISLDELNGSVPFEIYPNPATDYIELVVSKMYPSDKVDYTLHSTNGQILKSGVLHFNDDPRIDLGALPAGTYFLRLNQEVVLPFIIR